MQTYSQKVVVDDLKDCTLSCLSRYRNYLHMEVNLEKKVRTG